MNFNNSKGTPTKETSCQNLNNDYNAEFGSYVIPEVGTPTPLDDASKIFPDEVPRRDGPGGE